MFCSSIKCLPRQLTAELKERYVDAYQELLKRFEAEGGGFLGRIVKGDETWVHYHQRKPRKRARKGVIPPHQKPKKFRTQPSAGKAMLILCWDTRGVILEHHMPRGNTVSSTTYADLKNYLRPAIKSKRRGPLSTGVLLQRDNARSHTARSTVATIQVCPSSVFNIRRTRQTSPPSNFQVFGPLKEAMGCKSFRSDEEMQQAVHG